MPQNSELYGSSNVEHHWRDGPLFFLGGEGGGGG